MLSVILLSLLAIFVSPVAAQQGRSTIKCTVYFELIIIIIIIITLIITLIILIMIMIWFLYSAFS